MLVLNEDEVNELLTMDDYIQVLEEAFTELGLGQAVNRHRSDVSIPLEQNIISRFKSMEGGVPKLGTYAIRINPYLIKFTTVDGRRRQEKLPVIAEDRVVDFIIVLKVTTGEPLAMFPNGNIQRMRVGATSGVAAKALARQDASILGLLGSGWQAGSQLRALSRVRDIVEVRVYSPNKDHRKVFAEDMSKTLGLNVMPVDDPRTAVKGADIVSLATNSRDPAFKGEWLEPGMHLHCIQPLEVDDETARRCDVKITNARLWGKWRAEGRYPFLHDYVIGDREDVDVLFRHVTLPMNWEETPDLGDLLVGREPGRTNDRQITFHVNQIGLGMQFAAAGAKLCEKARQSGVGREIPTDWFLALFPRHRAIKN